MIRGAAPALDDAVPVPVGCSVFRVGAVEYPAAGASVVLVRAGFTLTVEPPVATALAFAVNGTAVAGVALGQKTAAVVPAGGGGGAAAALGSSTASMTCSTPLASRMSATTTRAAPLTRMAPAGVRVTLSVFVLPARVGTLVVLVSKDE